MTTVKEQIRQLGEALPEDVTWDQVMYEVYVREKIEKGEQAISERRTVSHDEVRRRFSTG